MKFQLVIEAAEKRLVLIPESPGETLMLGSICDPNSRHTEHSESKSVSIHVEASDDRAPYRKVKSLVITL